MYMHEYLHLLPCVCADVCLCMLCKLVFTRLHPSPLSLLPSLSPSQELVHQPDPRVAELVRLSPSWGRPVSEALHLSEPSGCSGAFGKRSGVVRGGGEVEV